MRRRLTIAMVVMVTAALALVAVVSVIATLHRTRTETRHELVAQGKSLIRYIPKAADTAHHRDPSLALRNTLREVRGPLRLQGATVVALDPGGDLVNPAQPGARPFLPAGITATRVDTPGLQDGEAVSGDYHSGVFAAVAQSQPVSVGVPPRELRLVVVLTRSPPTGLAAAGPWFLVSALVIVIASVIVADRLGRRFIRPLEATQEVTGRIAAGDLTARVPDPPGSDPELSALARAVNVMAESLARASHAERDFLLSVSHELRTPLTSIRGFAEAIEDGAAPDVPDAAGVITAESRRLERLVGDLLDLARLSARSFALAPADIDLADLVEAGTAGFMPEAARVGIRLDSEGPGPLPWRTDPDRLAQVVANLVENALSFASSAVHVGCAPVDGPPGRAAGVVVWVDDDGPGIAPADLPRVFDRLFSGRDSGNRKLGSGLGLAIVSELVAAMGGTIRAESPVPGSGGGTRIALTLPRA